MAESGRVRQALTHLSLYGGAMTVVDDVGPLNKMLATAITMLGPNIMTLPSRRLSEAARISMTAAGGGAQSASSRAMAGAIGGGGWSAEGAAAGAGAGIGVHAAGAGRGSGGRGRGGRGGATVSPASYHMPHASGWTLATADGSGAASGVPSLPSYVPLMPYPTWPIGASTLPAPPMWPATSGASSGGAGSGGGSLAGTLADSGADAVLHETLSGKKRKNDHRVTASWQAAQRRRVESEEIDAATAPLLPNEGVSPLALTLLLVNRYTAGMPSSIRAYLRAPGGWVRVLACAWQFPPLCSCRHAIDVVSCWRWVGSCHVASP